MTTKNKDILYTPGSQAPTNGDPLSYAQWLYGKSVYDAEQMRLQADKQAETDRQRAIVDANSAYQQGRATYGANAEAMAGMGLSSSGYGEYLTGKAYATQRGEVQSANVTAQARKDQALYEENSAKTQAAQIYANDLIGIKNQQTADYGALYDAATQGTSIEALMQDGRWASLTADQQSAIRQITSANSLKAQLDGGASLDDLRAGNSWAGLTVDSQQQLTNYYNTITSAKKAETDKNYAAYLDGINSGAYTPEDLKSLDGYANLSKEQRERLQSAYNGITDGIYNTYLNGIKDGTLTLEQIKADSAYKRLSPTLQGSLEYEAWKAKPAKENSDIQSAYDNLMSSAAMGTNFSLIFENEDYKKLNGTLQESIKNEFIDTVISQKTFATRTAFEKAMKENGLTNEKDIEEAVKRWQENEYNAMLSGSALLSGKDVYEAYESGVISKEQMNSYVKKKYGAQSAVYPSGSLSGVGAGSNIDEVTVTDKDGKQYRCDVNKLPKGVTSDELDAFFGGTPKAKSRGEADWVVYKGEVYIYGKYGWKVLKPYSIFSKNDLVNGLLKG